MKQILLILFALIITSTAFSQIRLYENFDYPVGDSIGAHGWAHNTGVTNTIFVVSPGLTYAGYPLTGIGSSTRLRNNGNDAYKNFPADSVGVLYASFMVSVDSARAGGDYFVALISPISTSNYVARFHVKDSLSNGALSFGLSKNTAGGGIQYTPGAYAYGVTYTVVIKYTFLPGLTDDPVSAYIFTAGIPATEPGTATLGPITGTLTDAPVGRIALRQGAVATSPTLNVDGIRVSDNWFGTYMQVTFAIQGVADANVSRSDTMQILLRNTSSPYAVVDQRTINVGFLSGKATGAFEYFTVSSGTYYLMGIYRNQPAFRNGINTWSAAGVALVNAGSYDFTTAASQALGSNQISVGGVFAMYNGDAVQDGAVDVSDIVDVFNDASNFESGYLSTDITGDEFVDVGDLIITFNNSSNFVSEIAP